MFSVLELKVLQIKELWKSLQLPDTGGKPELIKRYIEATGTDGVKMSTVNEICNENSDNINNKNKMVASNTIPEIGEPRVYGGEGAHAVVEGEGSTCYDSRIYGEYKPKCISEYKSRHSYYQYGDKCEWFEPK